MVKKTKKPENKKLDGNSFDITQDHIEKLKSVFPEVVTEGKVDWEKLKATLGKEDAEFRNERYVLNWAGKSEAFKVLQQSTTATLKPVPGESINFDATENVFIEGENLEVLKVLQKSYYTKVKCIIIDPPYNTGNDSFIYPDSFKENREEYQKRIGERDAEGYLMKEGFFRKNSKDSGHYHSNWLSMMYPRLFLAKNLLRDDGVIFVHIDDNEVHNLRLIMNEIFGEENFVAELVWKKRVSPANDSQWFSSDHEYILVYAKYKDQWFPFRLDRTEKQNSYYSNPDNDPRGPWNSAAYTCNKSKTERPNLFYAIINPITEEEIWPKETAVWAYSKETHLDHVKNKLLYWGADGKSKSPRKKQFLADADKVVPRSVLDYTEVGSTQSSTIDFLKIFEHNYINYTKPTQLLKRLIAFSTKKDDCVLDFFTGSATTAHAVLDLNKDDSGNRKFILVQLPELCAEESEAYKAGYKTIADIGKERIRRVIKIIEKEKSEKPELFEKGELDLGFKVFKLSSSNFKIWRGSEITEDNLESQLDAFTDPVREESETENILYELILKSGYLLTDKVEAIDKYYSINDGELIIALEKMTQKLIDKIIIAKPKKVIMLDKQFTGNDQLKTNTVLQMKDAEIDFKTI